MATVNGYMAFTRWPSMQRDSEILAQRIALEQKLRVIRANLHVAIKNIERDLREAA